MNNEQIEMKNDKENVVRSISFSFLQFHIYSHDNIFQFHVRLFHSQSEEEYSSSSLPLYSNETIHFHDEKYFLDFSLLLLSRFNKSTVNKEMNFIIGCYFILKPK